MIQHLFYLPIFLHVHTITVPCDCYFLEHELLVWEDESSTTARIESISTGCQTEPVYKEKGTGK